MILALTLRKSEQTHPCFHRYTLIYPRPQTETELPSILGQAGRPSLQHCTGNTSPLGSSSLVTAVTFSSIICMANASLQSWTQNKKGAVSFQENFPLFKINPYFDDLTPAPLPKKNTWQSKSSQMKSEQQLQIILLFQDINSSTTILRDDNLRPG